MTGEKMRVYEIAKEIGIPNKDLIAKIRALGLEVNNHMSSLDADDVARIKRSLEKEKTTGAAPQQTQRIATGGAVLRRRSSGDKTSETSGEVEPVKAPAPAVAAPVVRRRAVVEEAPAPAPTPPPAPAVVRRAPEPPPVVEMKAPVVETKAPVVETKAPIVEERPKHIEVPAKEPEPQPE